MGSYGQSVFGYRLLMFILLVLMLFFGVVAFYLLNGTSPQTVGEVVYVEVTPTTDPQPIPEAETLLEQAERELDDLNLLRMLFGEEAAYQFSDVDGKAEAKWVPAADSLGPWPANGARSYLTRILQMGIQNEESSERVIIFTQSAAIPTNSAECQALIGVAEFVFRDGEWENTTFQPVLQPEEGLCLVPEIEAAQFGEDMPGFIFHHTYSNKGELLKVDELYVRYLTDYSLVFSVETYHDNAGACPPNCYSTLVNYEWLPTPDAAVDDFLVTTRGTRWLEDQVVVVNETQVYKFIDGQYQAEVVEVEETEEAGDVDS